MHVLLAVASVAVWVFGQSNAAGRGEMVLPEDAAVEPDVAVLKVDGGLYEGAEPFDTRRGTGMGRTLARDLIASGRAQNVFVIQCAVGGTTVLAWSRTNSPLYARCLRGSRLAAAAGIATIAAVWLQGETESGVLYEERLRALKARLNADLPNVPLIAVEIPRSITRPGRLVVVAATELVADSFVTTEGLETRGPGSIHFDRSAQREIGRRVAAAILGYSLWPPFP